LAWRECSTTSADAILQKPGPLSVLEWDDMKRHARIGARIVAQNSLDDIGAWILCHHERPDGTGYPQGLREDEIPLEARILSVADAYEAMTSPRPYRVAPGPAIARRELRREAGRQFDRQVVDVFLGWVDEHEAQASTADGFSPRGDFSGSLRPGVGGMVNCAPRA
jgi:HD-GYP domain-containing protein (c-di-GMP phosphodiesterase class II)